ncbi:MAG: hypothetical protein RSA79_00160 [Oscillospiraceae bacterium]
MEISRQQTKNDFIKSNTVDLECLKTLKNKNHIVEKINSIIKTAQKLDMPDLLGEYEYSYKLVLDDEKKTFVPIIISHRFFWNEKMQCWNSDSEKIIGGQDLPLNA